MVATLAAIDAFNRRLDFAAAVSPPQQVVTEETYFRDNIGTVETAEDLLSDFRLYRYVMTAFDLADAVPDRAIVRRVLEEGSDQPEDLANRLNDPKFRALTDAIAFNQVGALNLRLPKFIDDVAAQYRRVQLEFQAGEENNAVRLASYFDRQISEASGWFAVLADRPLREVVFTALQLPEAMQSLDPDRLVEELDSRFNFEDFQDEGKRAEFIQRFAVFSDLQNGVSTTTPGSGALSLLTAANGNPGGLSLTI